MRNIFTNLYYFFSRHKILLFTVLAVSLLILLFFGSKLKPEEDIMSILPKTEESEKVNFVFQNMNSAEKIILRISPADTTTLSDPDILIEYAEQLNEQFAPLVNDSLLKEIFFKVDPSQMLEVMNFIYANLPYYMNDVDYQRVDSLLSKEKIKEILTRNRELLTSPLGMVYRSALLCDPLHLSNSILQELNGFQVENNYEMYDGYIFTKGKQELLMFLTPYLPSSETARNKVLIERLDNLLTKVENESSQTGSESQGIDITYFGAVAVAVANATQIKKDSIASILIAVILIAFILATYFKNIRSIVLLMLPIAYGAFLSLAALYFIKGTVSAIAIGTGSIIFGIAVDYSLHFLIHLRQEPSIEKTIRDISFPLLVGSTTTIAAFLTLVFLKSELLKDFGLFAAFTLIGTILFTLIFLPHFISQKKLDKEKINNNTIWNKIASYSFENNNLIIFIIVGLTILFSFFAGNVKFEGDMNKINYMTDKQREALKELSASTTLSNKLTYYVNEGNTIEEALVEYENNQYLLDRLSENHLTNSQNGIGHLLPSMKKQKEQIREWNQFWENRKDKVKQLLLKEGEKAGFTSSSFDRFFHILDQNFSAQESDYFSPLTESVLQNFIIKHDGHSVILSMLYSPPENAGEIVSELSGSENSFCFDTTTLTKSMLLELSSEFNYLLWICGLVVLIFLFISFGRLEITLITFLPMCVAFIWILGVMGIFDIRFNIINIILATFIFGIGDDYSIFIMEGLIYEYSYGKKMLSTYKTAVILSAVTMFIGIGSLIIAKHPAMFSLAQVTIIGMISVALVTYTVSPFIFKLITTKKGKKRLTPVTLWNLTKTVLSFIIFLTGSIILTLIGFFLITLGGKSNRHKYQFHLCLYAIMRVLCKLMIQVPFKVINPYHETFEKPGIIICNHQSHLDLLYTLALSPKIIVLTNKWVWNSPFYGWILRYADFIPIADGIEANVDRLKKLTGLGYSILIFPEGTRSEKCNILRFHKGAFYLADELNLDIIPVVLHGIGHILPKTEFMLRNGSVTVKILKRIPPGELVLRNFNETYLEAKAFRNLFEKEYKQIVLELENVDYFNSLVLHNYIYKGVSAERYARKLLKQKEALKEIVNKLPDQGQVVINHCGMGLITLMSALCKKDLQIIGRDSDPECLDIATNCTSVPENLIYANETFPGEHIDKHYNLISDKHRNIFLEEIS